MMISSRGWFKGLLRFALDQASDQMSKWDHWSILEPSRPSSDSEAGKREGAAFCFGGHKVTRPDCERGLFWSPTVLEASPDMQIAREEIFGPVLSAIRAADLDEAIKIANSMRYGLTASIFTRDISRAFRFADLIEAGLIHVNRPGLGGYSHAPFGGIKESGYGGREVGEEVLNFYTETKVVYINHR